MNNNFNKNDKNEFEYNKTNNNSENTDKNEFEYNKVENNSNEKENLGDVEFNLGNKSESKNLNIGEKADFENNSPEVSSSAPMVSPTMMVVKRFLRNKLAITGFVILIVMFLFSFVGGFFTPYGESQIFSKYETMAKEYASAVKNTDFRYTVKSGEKLDSSVKSKFILASNKGEDTFEASGIEYFITKESDTLYRIARLDKIGTAVNYNDIAIASKKIFDYAVMGTEADYEFVYAAEKAIINDGAEFIFEENSFEVDINDDIAVIYRLSDNGSTEKSEYATVSEFVVKPVSDDVYLPLSFKIAVKSAVDDMISSEKSSNTSNFSYTNENGETEEYSIDRLNNQFTVKSLTSSLVISMYEPPSREHWLGTDGNGMDIITRLMYGGRISLTIGFVVVMIELIIGVILGGISGYFSGAADTVIMRIVDILNCIPSYPLYIIIGAVMDTLRIDPKIRIYYLMLILGALGWTGIARLVRGQILSLREQEFMTAAEAVGIRVSRRIFRHLVPNIIPQLIVVATMGLGGIILTEATLSFLGLGVKFPYASWGNIINAVSNSYVMINYWFVWIPAGFLILLTVLGFNFVGDGLRDAFDPKMKR